MTEFDSVECVDTLASARPVETYTYTPLKQASSIRLLRLLPGDEGDTIACRVVHADIEEQPVYSAISYVWGDETQRVTILCDDTCVSITKSLANALQRFRPDRISGLQCRQLWADAICINQQNDQEREQQVRIMGKIYARAEKVLIWLGDEFQGLYTAVEYMKELVKQVWHRKEELFDWQPVEEHFLQDPAAINRYFGIKPVDAPEYQALRLLFGRAWFKRAWTFQESWLAQERVYVCGSTVLPHIDMQRVQIILIKLSEHTRDYRFFDLEQGMSVGMLQGQNRHITIREKKNMVNLLAMRQGALCKYPSDLVYSLVGSAVDGEQINISYSVSWQKILAEIVAHEIMRSQNLCIFGGIQASRPDLPTWVPDWRFYERRPRRRFSSVTADLYRCTSASKPVFSITADGTLLTLRGYVLDELETVFTDFEHAESFSNKMSLPSGRYLYTDEDWSIVAFRCLCADRRLYESPRSWLRWCPATAGERLKEIGQQQDSAYSSLIIKISILNDRSSLMATKAGRLGMVPNDARAGDLVCLMAGGEVPLILREKGEQFEFIGESYVHGCMDGECFDVEAELVESWHVLSDESKRANDVLRQLRDFVLC